MTAPAAGPVSSPEGPSGGRWSVTSEGVTLAAAESIVEGRRMHATRAVLESFRNDVLASRPLLVAVAKQGVPGIEAIDAILELIAEAVAEVEAAEVGCGADDGECTDPCHAGVRPQAT